MAFRPDYMTGTVTLTSGSTAFTTSGSALQSAAVQAGDSIITKGFILPIATITGQNSGTLLDACPAGAAGAAQPLRLRFLPDGSRFTAATRELIELLANGTIDALATAGSAADRLPFYSAVGVVSLLTFGAASRNQIAVGLTTAASTEKQTSAVDATAGRLLTFGAFGLGATHNLLNPDLNAVRETGFYYCNGPTNQPPGTSNGWLTQRSLLGTYFDQDFTDVSTGQRWHRSLLNSTFTPWTRYSLISGSNANGTYIRYGDGTQICLMPNKVFGTISTVAGSVFLGTQQTYTFPAQFINANPSCFGQDVGSTQVWTSCGGATASTVNVNMWCYSSLGASVRSINITAIGRWF